MKKLYLFLLILVLCFTITPSISANAAVKINQSNLSMSVGDTYHLKLYGTSKAIQWSSGNKTIAIVSATGKVKAVKTGKTAITARVGSKRYQCNITVICFKLFRGESRHIKICIAGDSTSDGDNGPSPYLYTYLKDFAKSGELLEGASFIDRGYSGCTTTYFIEHYLKATAAENADLYVLSLGINDAKKGGTTKDKLETNLIKIVNTLLQNKQAHVILRTPNSLAADDVNQKYIVPYTSAQKYTNLLWETYNNLRNRWSSDDVAGIDFMSLIFGRTCKNSSSNPLMKDVLHPSKLGQYYEAKLIAESVGEKEKPSTSECTAAKKKNPSAPYLVYPLYLDYAASKYNCIYRNIGLGALSSSGMILNGVTKSNIKLKTGDIIRFGNKGTVVYKGESCKTYKTKNLFIVHSFTSHQVTAFSTKNVWHVSIYRKNR